MFHSWAFRGRFKTWPSLKMCMNFWVLHTDCTPEQWRNSLWSHAPSTHTEKWKWTTVPQQHACQPQPYKIHLHAYSNLDMHSIWIKRLYRYLTPTVWNNTSTCVPTASTFLSAQLRGRRQTVLSPHGKKRCSTYSRDTEHMSRCCPVSAAISPSLFLFLSVSRCSVLFLLFLS